MQVLLQLLHEVLTRQFAKRVISVQQWMQNKGGPETY